MVDRPQTASLPEEEEAFSHCLEMNLLVYNYSQWIICCFCVFLHGRDGEGLSMVYSPRDS